MGSSIIDFRKSLQHMTDAGGYAMMKARSSVPPEQWISSSLWNKIIDVMPIPCVDIIFQREDRSILYGWRLINPYNNVWALPGGRVLHGENIKHCADRIARQYGLGFKGLYLVGVFPVNFPRRADVSIAVAVSDLSGEPMVDGFEFSKFAWRKAPPNGLGANYGRMVVKWVAASKSKDFLRLNRLR
jgi:ADP-ribose pyrophosphatase YjhB (NUDIX family)